MTLLESLTALVILATTAVGFLGVFHASARATREAGEWARATAYAESVMEVTKVLSPTEIGLDASSKMSAHVETRAWAPGVAEVVVVVTTRDGRRLELRRLTRTERAGASPGESPR